MVKVTRHSTVYAFRLAVLLVGRLRPIFSLVAPGQTVASPVSMPHVTFTTDG